MRNLFSILIFLSLAVAIGVIGRHLPEIKGYFKKRKKTKLGKIFPVVFLGNFGKKIGSLSLALAETTIKKFKNLLHLAHFWLIKLRKRKQPSEELREIEAKMELLEEEERTLEKVINEDLGHEEEDSLSEKEHLAEKFRKKSLPEPEFEASQEAEDFIAGKKKLELDQNNIQEFQYEEREEIEISRKQAIDQKINQFFSPAPESEELPSKEEERFSHTEELQQEDYLEENDLQDQEQQVIDEYEPVHQEKEKKKGGFFSNFAGKFTLGAFKKKPDWEREEEEEYPAENVQNEEDFSDGIVKVGEVSGNSAGKNSYQEENNLIKEVVKVGKKKEEYSDEDLGIDREILERKIIAKISANPKDQENYRQLGDLYLKMENFRDAEECYRQILKIKPRDIAARRKLEKIRLLKRLRQR